MEGELLFFINVFPLFRLRSRLSTVVFFFGVCLQTVWAQRGVQRLRPVDPSQRDGDEGAGKCLPPQGKIPRPHISELCLPLLV